MGIFFKCKYSHSQPDSPGMMPITLRTNSKVVSLISHCTATRRRCSSTIMWSMTSCIPAVSVASERWHCSRRMLRKAPQVWLYSCREGTNNVLQADISVGVFIHICMRVHLCLIQSMCMRMCKCIWDNEKDIVDSSWTWNLQSAAVKMIWKSLEEWSVLWLVASVTLRYC